MALAAGKLRHRIAIERQTDGGPDAETGRRELVWVSFAVDVPAEIVPLSGREFLAAAAGQAEVTSRCTIRYQAGVEPTMRIVHDGMIYNIRAVLPDPTLRRHITLMLAAGVNDGR